MRNTYLLFCLLAFLPVDTQAQRRRTRLPAELKEVSGMARLPNGDLWLLNDGGNSPDLFRYDLHARKIVETRRLPVPNRDWEELSADSAGFLYIGDFGNNFNNRRDLRIYRYHAASGALDSILFSYPDQQAFPPADTRNWNFDCEAMVFFQDSLHLFSKKRFKSDFVSKHYVLPARPGRYVAELRDSICLRRRVVTGAAVTEDGKTLVLSAYILGFHWGFIPFTKASAFYFNEYEGARFFSGKRKKQRLPKFLLARQFESALAWAPGVWLFANEGIGPQRPAIWRKKHP